ncbi:hypothetical protein EVAR_82744_1 [Eumeta japonica]|uniref:Uncharacterized protein n=1 Tax=Eumeta variegata TaxID=151549 RepID=A0A4C1ZZH3_EUMVA|nr:hypothetical protein EVAR_82744_1 [Eumeta japonica]
MRNGCNKPCGANSTRLTETEQFSGGRARDGRDPSRTDELARHVLVHEFMSIYYALAGWSGNRERRDERTKRKREKEKVRSRSKIPISSKPAVRNFVPKKFSQNCYAIVAAAGGPGRDGRSGRCSRRQRCITACRLRPAKLRIVSDFVN